MTPAQSLTAGWIGGGNPSVIATARQYHFHTSYDRQRMAGHSLDWANQPRVYKDYPGIEPMMLPRDVSPPEGPLSLLLRKSRPEAPFRQIDLNALSSTLLLAYTLTAKARHADGEFYYRSAASAGALYPTEIYVAAEGVKGIGDGLYHYAIHHHGLIPLRRQKLSSHILAITRLPEKRATTLVFFLTAIFFRSAWKYRERSYRYHLLDTGHVAENLILGLRAQDLPFSLTYDFDDEGVNKLLGLDASKEVALAVAHVPGEGSASDARVQEIDDLSEDVLKRSIVSAKEIEYAAVKEFHAAGKAPISRLEPGPGMNQELGPSPSAWEKLDLPSRSPVVFDYPEALFRRRSRRNFVRQPIPKDCMSGLLDSLCCEDLPGAFPGDVHGWSPIIGFLAGHVEGMSPGFYLLNAAAGSTGLVSGGDYMERTAHICLDQAWLVNAGAHFLFLADLDHVDRTWGARGYRYVMMTAGRLGERLYVTAESMGLGCCGIGAFYDAEAAEMLGLGDPAKLLYLVAVGRTKSA